MEEPRILIIGQPFNNNSGGGITLANLFTNWEKEKIAVVCTMHMFNNLNSDICDTYYLLGNREYRWAFPFNFIQRHSASGLRKLRKSQPAESQEIPTTPSFRAKLVNKYFYPFLEYAGLIHCISSIRLSDKFKNWLETYQPEIIYAQASSRETVLFCIAVQEYIKKPMVFHMMDDWPSTISEKGILKNYWKKVIDREFRILLEKCSLLLSISQAMTDEYKVRYGKYFIPFHNPIDLIFWKSGQKKDFALNPEPYVLYAGRIGPGIRDCLETMAKAIERYNKAAVKSLVFILQTKEIPEWVHHYSCVKHKLPVPYSELPITFGEADLLFLPYDFSEESIKFIKYSMPTKAPEYMISGTPVIIFAPSDTAIVKDAEKHKWAKLVTEDNAIRLATVIKELISNEAERRAIGLTAIEYAERNFNSDKVRFNFRESISQVLKS